MRISSSALLGVAGSGEGEWGGVHARLGHSLACVLVQTCHLVPIWKVGEEKVK